MGALFFARGSAGYPSDDPQNLAIFLALESNSLSSPLLPPPVDDNASRQLAQARIVGREALNALSEVEDAGADIKLAARQILRNQGVGPPGFYGRMSGAKGRPGATYMGTER